MRETRAPFRQRCWLSPWHSIALDLPSPLNNALDLPSPLHNALDLPSPLNNALDLPSPLNNALDLPSPLNKQMTVVFSRVGLFPVELSLYNSG
jgi:hypothetical protein